MPLTDCRVLIVEDDYNVGLQIADVICDAGGTVFGPFPTMIEALERMGNSVAVDGAILDVGLGKDQSFPLAEALTATRIPFLFLTGVEKSELPEMFASTPHMMKPFTAHRLVQAVLDCGIGRSNHGQSAG